MLSRRESDERGCNKLLATDQLIARRREENREPSLSQESKSPMRSGQESLAVGDSSEIFHASQTEVVNCYAAGTRRKTTREK